MKPNYLNEKVVLISGSSMGIGKAIAIELASYGAKIVLNGRDTEKLQQTKSDLKAKGYDVIAVPADIRNTVECKKLINKAIGHYQKLDILINNAAVSSRGSIEHMAETNFMILAETNFLGSAYLCKYAIPHLKKTEGHIICINSVGSFRGMPFNSAYSSTKMAQAALADALRIELYGYGIHVGIAHVGFTENDPRKIILDVDGSWVYLPKRTNIKLAKREAVAKSIRLMIIKRKHKITLTGLGKLTSFATRYLPGFSYLMLLLNRHIIEKQFTLIGGEKVTLKNPLLKKAKGVISTVEVKN
ncbi:SDR family NAD(P)-dependent oxidoreductase [Maribacter sp. CXY002]|uniref:SDR family NAD(P)-dependent oxidoreductase n=1 Tax=Maribacter luteocoastalis TaxID=3407671 RepID=UPI003B676DA0